MRKNLSLFTRSRVTGHEEDIGHGNSETKIPFLERCLGMRHLCVGKEMRLLHFLKFWSKVGVLASMASSVAFVISHELLFFHLDKTEGHERWCGEAMDDSIFGAIVFFQLCLSLTTVLVAISAVQFWKYRYELEIYNGYVSPRHAWWHADEFRTGFLELCVSVIHCPPGVRGCLWGGKLLDGSGEAMYDVQSLSVIVLFSRLHWILRYLVHHNKVTELRIVTRMFGIPASGFTGIKLLIKQRPLIFLGTFATLVILQFAYILMVFERAGDHRRFFGGSDEKTYWDVDFDTCLWFIWVVMTTVGFGDFYPMTVGGRMTAVFANGLGMVLTALLIGAISGALEVSSTENKVDVAIDSLRARRSRCFSAARVIFWWWRVRRDEISAAKAVANGDVRVAEPRRPSVNLQLHPLLDTPVLNDRNFTFAKIAWRKQRQEESQFLMLNEDDTRLMILDIRSDLEYLRRVIEESAGAGPLSKRCDSSPGRKGKGSGGSQSGSGGARLEVQDDDYSETRSATGTVENAVGIVEIPSESIAAEIPSGAVPADSLATPAPETEKDGQNIMAEMREMMAGSRRESDEQFRLLRQLLMQHSERVDRLNFEQEKKIQILQDFISENMAAGRTDANLRTVAPVESPAASVITPPGLWLSNSLSLDFPEPPPKNQLEKDISDFVTSFRAAGPQPDSSLSSSLLSSPRTQSRSGPRYLQSNVQTSTGPLPYAVLNPLEDTKTALTESVGGDAFVSHRIKKRTDDFDDSIPLGIC